MLELLEMLGMMKLDEVPCRFRMLYLHMSKDLLVDAAVRVE
jgi:hypothetical protein